MRLRGNAWLAGVFVVVAAAAGRARAAQLQLRAPESCPAEASVKAQVEQLLDRPLDEVEGVDFEATIERVSAQDWRLTLRTLPRDPGAKPRTRELSGASCEGVTSALAVALAMSIKGEDEQAEQTPAVPIPAPAPAREAAPASNAPARGEAASAAAAGAPARWRFSLGAGALLDGGALPQLAPGAQLELGASLSALRLGALGALFPSQTTHLPGSARGGSFVLGLGALQVCAQPALGRFWPLACAGFELGQLSGRGRGVLNTQLGGALWAAARLETGAGFELFAGLRLIARVGLALPLVRSKFVLDGKNQVHQPAAVSGRALLGLELAL